jgi:two-component system chemotaxis response regulator CheB
MSPRVVRDIVVLGTPAGDTAELVELLGLFAPDLAAAIFVVQQEAAASRTDVLERLRPALGSRADLARDGDRVERGRIFLAPQGQHLLIEADQLVVGHGPKLHGHCPSADLTFMSAATSYGERVVGVSLSGLLGETSAGLQVIHDRGGVALIEGAESECGAGWPGAGRGLRNVHWVTRQEIPKLLEEWCGGEERDSNKLV